MRGLPRSSELAERTRTSWSWEHELAATGVEVMYESYRALLALGGVRKGRIPRPLRVPRPKPVRPIDHQRSTTPPARRAVATTVDQIVAVLAASHKRIGS